MPLATAPRPPRTAASDRSGLPRRRLHAALLAGSTLAWVVLVGAVTLLPLPSGPWQCVSPELDPTTVLPRIVNGGLDGPAALRDNGALVQFLENGVMFLPLGAVVALVATPPRRALALASAAGFGTSLLIELTQLTGDWGAVRCAYRAFDVSDLCANTAGAMLGAILATGVVAAVHRRRIGRRAVPHGAAAE